MVRINALLPEDMIEELDRIAKEEKKSRSELLRAAAEKMIEEYHQRLKEIRRREKIKQAIEVQERLSKKSGQWNGVAEIRKWRERRS